LGINEKILRKLNASSRKVKLDITEAYSDMSTLMNSGLGVEKYIKLHRYDRWALKYYNAMKLYFDDQIQEFYQKEQSKAQADLSPPMKRKM
jgi:hypothetical protein